MKKLKIKRLTLFGKYEEINELIDILKSRNLKNIKVNYLEKRVMPEEEP